MKLIPSFVMVAFCLLLSTIFA